MEKLLIVVDMQNDFITGALANTEGQKIVSKLADYIKNFKGQVAITHDTHYEGYLNTQEGKNLPVEHCIIDTEGWELVPEIQAAIDACPCHDIVDFKKITFGSTYLGDFVARNSNSFEEIILCGVCTDICVISNALLIKAFAPEIKVTVLSDLCAGVTPEAHETALKAMQSCQINVTTSDAV